jgi:predicted AAA+ superfamily ATPase
MYDYHTYVEYPLIPRLAAAAVERALAVSPVTVLTGARQTGKTTLVRTLEALAGVP